MSQVSELFRNSYMTNIFNHLNNIVSELVQDLIVVNLAIGVDINPSSKNMD
jgi:hypothetical protein